MNDLKLIESKLVPVYETSTSEKVVYGTELYECLESKRQYTDWIKERLSDCDAKENKDFQTFSQKNEKGGRPKTEYIIKLDIAKEMAMLERNKKGKEVRRYFIRVEEKYKERQIPPLTLQQQIQTIAKGTDELYQRMDKVSDEVQTVKADMENIKQDLPLFPSEADEICNAINKRVIMLLGGKEFNSYKDKSLRKKVFTDCYQNLKHNFGDVTTYKAIKRGQKVQALQIIAEYKPPLFLTKQIELVNAQQVLNI